MGMSNENQTPATYEDKQSVVMEYAEICKRIYGLKKRIEKMSVKDSIYWKGFQDDIDAVYGVTKVSVVNATAILLER